MTGSRGEPGITGRKGPPGNRGQAGDKGQKGMEGSKGTGSPSLSQYVNCTLSLDDLRNITYHCLVSCA